LFRRRTRLADSRAGARDDGAWLHPGSVDGPMTDPPPAPGDPRPASGQPGRPAELPSGTITLVMTDIEGSTELVGQLAERYPAILLEHRDLLRQTFSARRAAGRGGRRRRPGGL
jgi:hypothetical protein